MLGKDETTVLEVDTQMLPAFVKKPGNESVSIILKPEPQAGDAQGKTSQFVGRFPRELDGRQLEVTIPSLRIGGERYRVPFSNKVAASGHAEPMPASSDDEEERKLYLTPGGKYTAKDIEANGKMTATEKFKGVMARHDLKPKAGEQLCPITLTKANPKFGWIVDGKRYEFCCPPCVDEFVKMAKESPDEIKVPSAYVKK
jgi:hypothetical protein